MISCIAIDDEPIALDVIKTHASKIPFLSLKATFLSPVQAMEYMRMEPVELVFLDINMPDLSGIELARRMNNRPAIVFTTAHTEYAIQAFELSAIDYLLKPISFERFLTACHRAQEQQTSTEKEKSIFVKDGNEWIKMQLNQILYVEASDNYLIFQENNRRIITRMTLSEAEGKLPRDIFIRVHKSFLINFTNVEKVNSNHVTIHGKLIPISATYRNEVLGKVK